MRVKLVHYLCLLTMVCGPVGHSQSPTTLEGSPRVSPVGRWKTIDDITGKANSVVIIGENNGRLYGKIEKLIDPDPQDLDPRCTRCEGALRDKPLVGLQILWDFQKDGDRWSGGRVLDPDTGRVYKCYLAVEDRGTRLKVRGFIGFSLLGRTQYWVRNQ